MKESFLIISFFLFNLTFSNAQATKFGSLNVKKNKVDSIEDTIDTLSNTGLSPISSFNSLLDTIDYDTLLPYGRSKKSDDYKLYFDSNKVYVFDEPFKHKRLITLSLKNKKKKKFLHKIDKLKSKGEIDFSVYEWFWENWANRNTDSINYYWYHYYQANRKKRKIKTHKQLNLSSISLIYNSDTIKLHCGTFLVDINTLQDQNLKNNYNNSLIHSISNQLDLVSDLPLKKGIYKTFKRLNNIRYSLKFDLNGFIQKTFKIVYNDTIKIVKYEIKDNKIIALTPNPLFTEAKLKSNNRIEFKIDRRKYVFKLT